MSVLQGLLIAISGGGATNLIAENFEAPGYELSWTEAGTGTKTPNYATSPAPLAGSYSLRIVASSQTPNVTSPTFTAQGDLWAYFLLNVASLPSANRTLFQFRDSSSALASIQLMSTGAQRAVIASNGTNSVATISATTTYHVWMHYTKGSGSNAVLTIAFSTDGIKPTSGNSFASVTNGTSTTDCDRVMIGGTSSSTIDFIVDKIRVSASTIGDNPS